ncbi:MAG: adenosylcobinamide-GDP ribazoletransferase [Burkholderiaceae bacterium]|nr:adenosylcobinamide-GDP ribazoletransferase [Burkholderiaceae bacterium]
MAHPSENVSGAGDAWPLRQLRLFLLALQFFTRVAVPHWVDFREEWLGRTARFFPLIGWIAGAVSAAVAWGAACVLPPLPALLLALIAGVLLTGALHEDGFADVCDGFGGGVTRERVLEIMRDSRIGVYGALGLGLLVALKLSCLAALPSIGVAAAMLAAHPLSRAFAAALMWKLEYARSEGKAAPVAQRMSGGEFLFAALCGVIPASAVIGVGLLHWQAVLAGISVALLLTGYATRLFVRRIGGYTGDCLGAIQQISETGFYLGLTSWYFLATSGRL